MKKKLLSLLLVIAVMMTSVSMGFGSLVATAGAAGGGVEAINAFSLTGGSATGTSFSTSITIKSKTSGYQIKVNSISAVIRFYQDEASNLSTVNVDASAVGKVIGTGGQTFSVSGTIGAGLAGLIRYECNYDLLDSNGNVKYAGMTGYGYGVVSANGQQTGALGTESSEPERPGDRYYFGHFNTINSLYVQTPSIVLSSNQETSYNAIAGAGSQSRSFTMEGTYPSTITLRTLEWEYVEMYGEGDVTTTWFEMNSMPNGYFNFMLKYNGADYHRVEMYYRSDEAKNQALNLFNQYLAEGREKSYYTAESWDYYLQVLELTALCGMAIPGPNVAFQLACQYADVAAGGTYLTNAKAGLTPVAADYTAMNEAYDAFTAVKDNTVTVRTYDGGTSLGSETIRLYVQSSVDEVVAYKNSCNTGLYKYDQPTVDNYTATIKSMTANLTYSDAVYKYLDKAIEEHSTKKASDYTTTTWAPYDTAIANAKALSRSLKANEQAKINEALNTIVSAKINLKYVQADTTVLKEQIENGDDLYTEYDNSKLLTNLEGFDQAWANFEAAYTQANAVKGYTIDKQADVDAAAEELARTISILSNYRLLDTTELQKVLALTPEYEQSKYVPDSYNTWSSLRVEGYSFLAKAQANYTGEDRKTYNNLDEMNRLINLIQMSFDGLEKNKADFTELNEQVAKIPSEEVLALYKPEIVEAIKAVVATINYGATFEEQEEVDEIALNLKYALAELTPANYRDADYSGVEDAIADANALDRSKYVNFEIVDEAISAVDYTKKIVDQADVDDMEKAIRDAIAALGFVLADYSDVEDAIAEAEAVENKDWYANYYIITDIIEGINWNITLDNQEEVDAYAVAIRQAIKDLTLAEADYSGVSAAIAEAKTLEPLADYTNESVERLDLAISKVVAGYTKDKQSDVDAMEAEIRNAIAAMELLPANYLNLNIAIDYAQSFKPEEYSNYDVVQDAIDNVNWDLNCRQTEEMQAQIDAIYDAVKALKLLPADYSQLEQAVEDARYACANGAYPYTEESIQAVEAEIAKINWDLDVQSQSLVNAYIVAISDAVKNLKYIKADYTGVNDAINAYNQLDKDLYASTAELDAYIATIDWNITIDKQEDVNAIAATITELMGELEYGPADYSAVDVAVAAYNNLKRNYYEAEDLAVVEEVVGAVEYGYTKERQADVDKMAQNINYALDVLATKIKKADLTALNEAKAAASAKIAEMQATGYEINQDTFSTLYNIVTQATSLFNEDTKIDKQESIDAYTAQIIEATANLEYVFTIDLKGSGLVIDGGYIYGFEEGVMAEDARELIKFVGPAELKIYETKNGFGTGTMIQFISTDDGSILGTYTVLVYGDANGDAVIDTFDVAYITEVVNSGDDPSVLELAVLDIFKDGYIDAMDVSIMISLANMDATLMQDGSMGTY